MVFLPMNMWCVCWGGKIFLYFWGSFGCLRIKLIWIGYRRKSGLIMHLQELHRNMRPPGSWATGAYMPSKAKEKGVWVWKRRKTIHRSMKRSKYLENKYLLDCAETMGHRGILTWLCWVPSCLPHLVHIIL